MSEETKELNQDTPVTITGTLGGFYSLIAYIGDYPLTTEGIQRMCDVLATIQHTLSDVCGTERRPNIFKPEEIQAQQDMINELSSVFSVFQDDGSVKH